MPAADYPEDAFLSLSSMVTPVLFTPIIAPLFHLLSRFAAHSHLSGLTPHSLASLFAPLLINIPTSSPATTSHATFVRAASATEHLLLAYIRSSGSPTALGTSDLPSRLRSWVAGYPSMVATDADFAFGSPRRGAKVVRCERVTRTVRAYSKDLVVGAELWAADIPPDTKWEAWDRVVLKHRRGDAGRPKFTSSYRRKMGVREKLPLPASAGESSILSGTSSFDYGKAQIPKLHDDRSPQERDRRAMGKGTDNGEGDEARWGSLAGKEWSMFEEGGFGGGSSIDVGDFGERRDNMRERLQFDMTEGAKTVRELVAPHYLFSGCHISSFQPQSFVLLTYAYARASLPNARRWTGPNSHLHPVALPVLMPLSPSPSASRNQSQRPFRHGHRNETPYRRSCTDHRRRPSRLATTPRRESEL